MEHRTNKGSQEATGGDSDASLRGRLKRFVDWALVPVAAGSIVNTLIGFLASFPGVQLRGGFRDWGDLVVVGTVAVATLLKLLTERRD